MSDLGDILDSIQAEEPEPTKQSGIPWFKKQISSEYKAPERWTEADKTIADQHVEFTKYELYWLLWRVEVHLRSYEQIEWSEMKEALTVCKAKLETLWFQSTKEPWFEASMSTPVADVSIPASTQEESSPPSGASDVPPT